MDAAHMVADVRGVPTSLRSNAAIVGMSLVLMSTTCAGRVGVLTTSVTHMPAAVASIVVYNLALAETRRMGRWLHVTTPTGVQLRRRWVLLMQCGRARRQRLPQAATQRHRCGNPPKKPGFLCMQCRLPMDAAHMVADVRSVPTYPQSNAAIVGMSLVLMSTICVGRVGVLTTSVTRTPAAVVSIVV